MKSKYDNHFLEKYLVVKLSAFKVIFLLSNIAEECRNLRKLVLLTNLLNAYNYVNCDWFCWVRLVHVWFG